MRTVFCFRMRINDSDPWSYPEFYKTRKERNYTASLVRIFAGIKVWSYEEKMTAEQFQKLFHRDSVAEVEPEQAISCEDREENGK